MSKSKLSEEQKIQMYEMYTAGESPADIARRFGCSRQGVYSVLARMVLLGGGGSKRRLPADVERSPYANFREWLRDASHPNVSQFCRDVFGNTNTARFLRIMRGGEQAHVTVSNIRRMEQLTGMPFSQLFARSDQGKEDDPVHDDSAV